LIPHIMATKDNAHEIEGNWAPPNVEGKDPHAAFSVFLAYTKRILRPAELGHLIRPRLQSLPDKERSIITTRDELRETCGPERQTIKDRLSQMANAVEMYCKANRPNPFLSERLGWLIQEVTVWDPEIIKSGDINFSNKEHLEENSERLRRDERMAGMDEFDKAVEVGIADGFVNAVFRTDELRAELAQHLKGIAGSIAVDPVATNGTTATKGTPERLKWKSSTAAFAHIFNTLAQEGYFDFPRKGGKENDPNFTGFARVLLQAFDVKGEDGNSLTPEQLRVRLRPSAPRPLAETKTAKFQIPDKGILIVPNADEMK